MESSGMVTALLRRWGDGDSSARDELIPLIYGNLKQLAAKAMRNENPGHTLRPTALVNEVYLRLAGGETPWQDRIHFFAITSRVMRRILVDHAKARRSQKRGGGGHAVTLNEEVFASPGDDVVGVLALDVAMEKLAAIDSRKAELLEMIYFGGMTLEECGKALGISTTTVHREASFAKAWLMKELQPGPK
jgi:RNA polymerase sigma factor (TIGR02999 family)